MITKTDSAKVRILELLAMTDELSGSNIKSFFSSNAYVEKLITSLKKESLIRNANKEGKPIYRLTKRGREVLRDVLPDIFVPLLDGHKTMNRIREEKRKIERRQKLVEVLNLFVEAGVKIFPDEKVIINNYFTNARTDNTDETDSIYNCEPEFYTATEIKNLVPDYKKAIGSRALGVFISYGRIYIIYSTETGDLLWRPETEKNFGEVTRTALSRKLYGKDGKIYFLVLGDKVKAVQSIMNRYDSTRTKGMIHPGSDLPNMIFALKDIKKDATLRIITKAFDHIAEKEREENMGIVPDGHFPCFAGRSQEDKLTYYLNTYLFDMCKVAAGIKECADKGINVIINCFDYQVDYVKSIVKEEFQDRITYETTRLEVGSDADEE